MKTNMIRGNDEASGTRQIACIIREGDKRAFWHSSDYMYLLLNRKSLGRCLSTLKGLKIFYFGWTNKKKGHINSLRVSSTKKMEKNRR